MRIECAGRAWRYDQPERRLPPIDLMQQSDLSGILLAADARLGNVAPDRGFRHADELSALFAASVQPDVGPPVPTG